MPHEIALVVGREGGDHVLLLHVCVLVLHVEARPLDDLRSEVAGTLVLNQEVHRPLQPQHHLLRLQRGRPVDLVHLYMYI